MSKYMVVLMLSLSVPLVCSFWPPLKFYSHFRALLCSIFSVALIYGAWDVVAVYRHHWFFNPDGIWSFKIINLPVEEVLFFIVIPFCCIFTWEAVLFIMKKRH
ncbi:MAG: lycopene cyclase domain-containing protein [Candidatus Omnitrophota bacterium]